MLRCSALQRDHNNQASSRVACNPALNRDVTWAREEYNLWMLSFSWREYEGESRRDLASVPSAHRPQPHDEKVQGKQIQQRTESVDNLEMGIRIFSADSRLINTYCGGCSPSRPSELGLWKGRTVNSDAALEENGLDSQRNWKYINSSFLN